MHEEDGQGLEVVCPAGKSWTCYGDAKLFQTDQDSHKTINLEQCRAALSQSVKEIHEAYKTKKVIVEKDFGAWKLAPDLTKVNKMNAQHQPLLSIGSDGLLYVRNGDPTSTDKTCMDNRWPVTEYPLWVKFYYQNKTWVADKVWKYLGLP